MPRLAEPPCLPAMSPPISCFFLLVRCEDDRLVFARKIAIRAARAVLLAMGGPGDATGGEEPDAEGGPGSEVDTFRDESDVADAAQGAGGGSCGAGGASGSAGSSAASRRLPPPDDRGASSATGALPAPESRRMPEQAKEPKRLPGAKQEVRDTLTPSKLGAAARRHSTGTGKAYAGDATAQGGGFLAGR